MADRRPLASRDTKPARRAAQWLAQTRITPNAISAASVGFALLAGGAFWATGGAGATGRAVLLVLAALGCQLRLACNLLDGMVAVEGGQAAPDGPFWNEVPDRLADMVILVALGLGAGWPALGWAAAAMAVLTAYIRETGTGLGRSADFSGPMAKPQRMAVVTGAALLAILWPGALLWALWIVTLGAGATAARRAWHLLLFLRGAGPFNRS